jgi:hypothetical protein
MPNSHPPACCRLILPAYPVGARMTLKDYSRLARQARSRMPRLSCAVAYAQMEQLMGKMGTSPGRSVSGTNLEGSADTPVRSLE